MINNELDTLFQLSSGERDLTEQLQQIIRAEIEANSGIISFSRYMELALYYPSLGYYSNPLFKFGEQGDFVTAPLISNIFGQLLARQISELFSFGLKRQVLEFGAGNGQLATDFFFFLETVFFFLETAFVFLGFKDFLFAAFKDFFLPVDFFFFLVDFFFFLATVVPFFAALAFFFFFFLRAKKLPSFFTSLSKE